MPASQPSRDLTDYDFLQDKRCYTLIIQRKSEDIEKIYARVYGKMSQALKKSGATVFSCIIKIQQLRALFFLDENHNGIHLIDDQYSIALQKKY